MGLLWLPNPNLNIHIFPAKQWVIYSRLKVFIVSSLKIQTIFITSSINFIPFKQMSMNLGGRAERAQVNTEDLLLT